jgi:hypothetical protein
MSSNFIDIIERAQLRHALHEEHELQNLDALSHSPVALIKVRKAYPKQTECEYRQPRFQEERNGHRRTMAEIDWS